MQQSIVVTPSSSASPASLPRALVLVVDPNPTTRSVLEVALSRDGFDVWSSSSGQKAFELLRPGRIPDVVVVESDLGAEDGFSFVAQLRGESATASTPVLLLASAKDRNVEALAEVVGIDQCIQKPAYARDVVALVRLEHARRQGETEVTFHASQLPPAHLLRALLSCPRSGRLTLADGRAGVSFRNGRLIEVRFEDRGDLDSLVRALALTRGSYTLSLETVEGFAELQLGLRELVTQVMPRLSRWEQVQTRSLPLHSKLVVDFARLAPALKTMPDGINRVTQLFDGYRTLQDVLIDSPFNETLTLEIATRLYLMGVIVPAQAHAAESQGRVAPRLFEPSANEAAELMQELFAGGEIRGDAPFPSDDRDWFEEPRGTGLEVSEPSGGWTTTPAPEVLAGLAPEVAAQLEAFAIRVEVEPPAQHPDARALSSFVRGEPEQEPSSSLQGAVQLATGDERAQLADFADDPTPPLGAPRISDEELWAPPPRPSPGRVPEALAAPAPAPAAAEPTPALELEQTFFGEEATSDELPVPRKRKVFPLSGWLAFGLAVVAVAALIEAGMAGRSLLVAPVAPAAFVAGPAVEIAPAPSAPAPVATVEEAPAAPPSIDISENLVEARKFYENGRYSQALSVLEQVLSDAPRSVDAWLLTAMARFDSNQVGPAKDAVEHVLELDPKNSQVQILIASMALAANDRERADAALTRYLELDPGGPSALEAHKLLKH